MNNITFENITFEIDAKLLLQYLKTRPQKMEKAFANIIKKSALLIERFSKAVTPVDSGRLRSSISSDIHPMTASVSTHTNYAIYVHEGTRYMSPRPFMRDGASYAEAELESIMSEEVSLALKN